jgi:hypothetical protein
MQKWEYTLFRKHWNHFWVYKTYGKKVKFDSEDYDLAFYLAEFGREGWEAVSFQCEREPTFDAWPGDVEILFKRPVEE